MADRSTTPYEIRPILACPVLFLRDKGQSSRFSFQSPGNAKPEIDVRNRRIIVKAIRRRSVPPTVNERAATQHTGGTDALQDIAALRNGIVPRLAPLPNVAVHVVQAPGVGLVGTDGRRPSQVRYILRVTVGIVSVEIGLVQ